MRLPRAAALAVGSALVVSWSALTAESQRPANGLLSASGPVGRKVDPGERLYREGVASGGPVEATVQGDLRVPSSDMACANCHRRSGLGTVEGPVTSPAVTGRVLFNPVTLGNAQLGLRTTGPWTRPAYDEPSLARALGEGIDPAGRVLSPTMPRYPLSDADVAGLAAYLRTLDAPPPGVADTTLHVATITSAAAEPRRQEAMLAVLREFVRAVNAEPRYQTRRREVGPWDMKSHYELYRRWALHEWTLGANPRDWPGELAAQYARQPVFAVVSGTTGGAWSPIHAFCDQKGVPCVFPQAAAPPGARADAGFYSPGFWRTLIKVPPEPGGAFAKVEPRFVPELAGLQQRQPRFREPLIMFSRKIAAAPLSLAAVGFAALVAPTLLAREQAEQPRVDAAVMSALVRAEPVAYEISAAIARGRFATVTRRTLAVPDPSATVLTASPVVLGDSAVPWAGADAGGRAFSFASTSLMPAAVNRFRQSDNLHTALRVFGWKPDNDSKPDVTVEYVFQERFGSHARCFNKTKPQDLNAKMLSRAFNAASGALAMGITVPLAAFPAGEFQVVVRVRDKRTRASAQQVATFTVAAS